MQSIQIRQEGFREKKHCLQHTLTCNPAAKISPNKMSKLGSASCTVAVEMSCLLELYQVPIAIATYKLAEERTYNSGSRAAAATTINSSATDTQVKSNSCFDIKLIMHVNKQIIKTTKSMPWLLVQGLQWPGCD